MAERADLVRDSKTGTQNEAIHSSLTPQSGVPKQESSASVI
jgi:hypothetical protein